MLASGALGSMLVEVSSLSESVMAEPGNEPLEPLPAACHTPLIWANLLHLSYNMWCDRPTEKWSRFGKDDINMTYRPYLRFDDALWENLTNRMARAGMNMVVIDLGDGVRYESHPEIAVKDAWPVERLRKELARLHKLGLEPIPKLNFSAAHDTWLGTYARQVSTPVYYRVCEDLIAEVVNLFDKPRFFHLGYDEETACHQSNYTYTVIRQDELWWHDFLFFVKQVENHGVRSWIWSDYAWRHGKEFLQKMPKSVLQSNWYYELDFKDTNDSVCWYGKLSREGYDQMPTGSNWSNSKNFGMLVKYCRKNIAPSQLKGFLYTTWLPTMEKFRPKHLEAINQVEAAIAACSIRK